MKIFLTVMTVLVVLFLGGIFWIQFEGRQQRIAAQAAQAAQQAREEQQQRAEAITTAYTDITNSARVLDNKRYTVEVMCEDANATEAERMNYTNDFMSELGDLIMKASFYGFISSSNVDTLLTNRSIDEAAQLDQMLNGSSVPRPKPPQ